MGQMTQHNLIHADLDYSRLEAAIQSIEVRLPSGKQWEAAQSPAQTLLYILRSADNVGVSQPFTTEQNELNAYLTERLAGRRLCDYAWRVLAQSL